MDDLVPGPDETLDPIAGSWRVFQLRRGHRFSVDDVLTGWRAAHARPAARRLLDLGCGIGSVGLSTLWRLGHPDATLVGVEAQAISVDLARRSVRLNGLAARVHVLHGDLRDPDVIPSHLRPEGGFELITGSPPYIPEGHGVLSPIPQRAGARIELRGSIYDYCAAARRHLAPGGRFAFVMAAADPRTEDAPRAHGFTVVERVDAVFRGGRDPHIAVLVCARAEDLPEPVERATRTLVIRDADGVFTPDYQAFRAEMGGDGPLARARRAAKRR
jgi:tRNA1Val (adenine37-N6)-methyltransferase